MDRVTVALLLIVAGVFVAVEPASSPARADDGGVSCASQAAAEGMSRATVLPLPAVGEGWRDIAPPMSVDDRAELGPVDRVGYCLELVRDGRREWVWTSFEATGKSSDLALPHRTGDITREDARRLTVRSNVPGVADLTHGRGWLEMWPNGQEPRATRQLPGSYRGNAFSLDSGYDADDNPNNLTYGSFQVHSVGASSTATVLAVNGWARAEAALDVGIGTNPHGHPDWTSAANAGQYTERTLTTYGRPATVSLEVVPETRQLIPRATRQSPWVTTRVSGTVVHPDIQGLRLDVHRAGLVNRMDLVVTNGRFTADVDIPAALVSTDLELSAEVDGDRRILHTVEDVVAGDVIVIHGQSNAEARRWGTTAHHLDSPFVRSIGTNWLYPDISAADRTWYHGRADTGMISGAVGQWGMQMARQIMTHRRVPVAVIQGSHGGRPISWFLRDGEDPANVGTNYGRLLARLKDAELHHNVSAIFWNHGESDNNDAVAHRRGASNVIRGLLSDLSDAGDRPQFYLMQVRNSPCGDSEAIELRDEQRIMAHDLGVSLFSQNSLDAAVGCHWDFEGGYEVLGDLAWESVRSDVYGSGAPRSGLHPEPLRAQVTGVREITLVMSTNEPLTVEPGVERDFRIDGEPGVTAVRAAGPDRLVLVTGEPVAADSTISYVAHQGAGPWITDRVGAGLVAFSLDLGSS